MNNGENYNVAVTPFDKNNLVNVVTVKKGESRIESVTWANNERLLVKASYVESIAGKNFKLGKLYAVNKDGSDLTEIRSRASRDDRYARYRSKTNVISYLKDDPKHILLQGYSERDEYPVVYKVNIYDNNFEKLFANHYKVSSWYANQKGEVVLGLAYGEENPNLRKFWYRQPGTEEWSVIGEYEAGENAVFNPVAFDSDKGLAYVLTDYKTGVMSLYTFDIKKGVYADQVYSNENYDLEGVILENDKVVGVRYYDDYLEQHYFEPEDHKLNQLIKGSFKAFEATVAAKSRNNKRVIVYGIRDNMPGTYYLVDLNKGTAKPWFSQYPYLSGKPLSTKQNFSFKTSDGLTITGYLSRPLNSDGKAPLVVLPHGGPAARDYKYFDPLAQLLTSRGYAVLQPNFRGSAGFGSAFEASGYKEWGLKMQDDVIEAVDWALQQGGIDKDHMCMVGLSYGGYAAETAAFKTPEKFNCFVSVAGVSDIEAFVSKDRAFGVLDSLRQDMVGNVENPADVKRMRENSLVHHIDAVKNPILLIHGDRDTRVSTSQSQNIYEKLKNANKPVQYIELEYGSHFLDSEPNRIKAFSAITDFLEKHI
ncbi:alpha/beta hydrolase family protein [Idiomarina tyrosinivorans]|uniref:alpha/beta hydrolase family protein n=1 Tax=Idiomarina tyrosinivorans TaxID=1445662 RepID=UPI0018E4EC5F|nr:alpha/beta fold hydrolase [Idiomarina tyrosinivorans]